MGFKLPDWKDFNSFSDLGGAIEEVVEDAGSTISEAWKDFVDSIELQDTASKTNRPGISRLLVNQYGINAWIPVIYGRARVGGTIAFTGISGTNKDYYHIALVICEGEIDAINNIYIDDIRADDDRFLNGNKYTTGTVSATNGSKVITGTGTTWTTNAAAGDTISFDKSYTTGTVSATNGSKIVTGSSTLWIDNANAGDAIVINSVPYTISSIDSNTQIILTANYAGGTSSGLSYSINYLEDPFYYIQSVDSNTQITLDTEYLGTTGSGKTYVRKQSLVRVYKYNGTTTQSADANLVSTFADIGYTSAAQGKGLAWIHVKILKTPNAFSASPRVNVDVRGKKCFDPRDSGTRYTTNGVLHTRDYLTNTIYGMSFPTSSMSDTENNVSADYCDATITEYTGGGNIKRFEFNGVLDTEKEPLDNVRDIVNSYWGMLYKINGKYRIRIKKAESAVYTFDKDNIIGPIKLEGSSKDSRKNTIRVKYRNPRANWQEDMYVLKSSAYLTEDGNLELEQDISFPHETNQYRAQYHAEIAIKSSRKTLRVSLTASPEALKVEEGDIVNLTHATYGWTNKKFRAIVVTLLPSFLVGCLLQEHDDAIYDRTDPAQLSAVPGTNLYNSRDVPAPTGLTFLSNTTTNAKNTDGTIQYTAKLSWTGIPNVYLDYYEVQVKNSTDSTWKEHLTIVGTEVLIPLNHYFQKYDFRVRAVNVHGYKGPYATLSDQTCGRDTRMHYINEFDSKDKLSIYLSTPSGSVNITTDNELLLEAGLSSNNLTQAVSVLPAGNTLNWSRKFCIESKLKIKYGGTLARIKTARIYLGNGDLNLVSIVFAHQSDVLTNNMEIRAVYALDDSISRTTVVLTTTVVEDTFYRFRFVYYPDDKMEFYIDDVLKSTILESDAEFPLSTLGGVAIPYGYEVTQGTNIAAAASVSIDRVIVSEL